MELIFIIPIATVVGLIARYLPGHDRSTYGAAALPVTTCALASVIWVSLTWVGVPGTSIWAWVATLGTTVAAAYVFVKLVSTYRSKSDQELLNRLSA